MAKKPPAKITRDLTAMTAEKVFGWKNVHQYAGKLIGKKQDKAGRWRKAKIPAYASDPAHADAIEDRMKRSTAGTATTENFPALRKSKTFLEIGPRPNSGVGPRSKR